MELKVGFIRRAASRVKRVFTRKSSSSTSTSSTSSTSSTTSSAPRSRGTVIISGGGPMSVGTPFQQRGSGSTTKAPVPSRGGGSSTVPGKVIQTPSGKVSIADTSKVTAKTTGKITPLSTVSQAPKKPKGVLEGLSFSIGRKQEELRTKELRGKGKDIKTQASLVGLGFGSAAISGAIGVKQLVTKPKETIKQTPSAIKSLPQQGKKFGKTLRESPATALGVVGANVAIFKAPTLIKKGVIKGTDVVRTTGKIELKATDVIAPEFPKQTFPKIKKGQTAGELLGEFKQPEQFGVTRLRGFTAAPKPFAKTTEAARGTSEFPGVFQAPKVSPHFLRISGENEKLFTLAPFGETLRPSITKIQPKEFKLVPGVKPSQKTLNPNLKQTQQFFETAPKGKSFVPFAKTEKEAVIPFGTKLKRSDSRFFVKFEGRRVPIAEFETINGGKVAQKGLTVKSISKGSSGRRIGSKGKFSPSDITSIPRSRKRTTSSRVKFPPSRGRASPSLSSPTKFSESFSPPSRTSRGFKPTKSSLSIPRATRTSTQFLPPTRKTPFKFKTSFGKTKKRFDSIKSKKIKIPRTPSLVAIGTGIKSTEFGKAEASGLTIRPILVSRPRKKKKGGNKK